MFFDPYNLLAVHPMWCTVIPSDILSSRVIHCHPERSRGIPLAHFSHHPSYLPFRQQKNCVRHLSNAGYLTHDLFHTMNSSSLPLETHRIEFVHEPFFYATLFLTQLTSKYPYPQCSVFLRFVRYVAMTMLFLFYALSRLIGNQKTIYERWFFGRRYRIRTYDPLCVKQVL